MAESARQSSTQGDLDGEGGENSADGDGLGGGDNTLKDGTKVNGVSGKNSGTRHMSWSDITAAAVEPLDVMLTTDVEHLEAIQVHTGGCVKKKNYIHVSERSRRRRSVDSLQGGYSYNLLANGVSIDIKGKDTYGQLDSIVLEGLGSGYTTAVESDLACTDMERVDSTDNFYYSSNDETLHCSPNHFSSGDEANCDWEASDHSDTDTDHSDSSDDDNPTSQVDRMIERGTRLIMDGENSNLSSETEDDTDSEFDDTDSDITDVSPLVSNSTSPLCMSPVIQRRNLPSSMITRPPFARYYGVRGTDGDVEDELDENGMIRSFDQIYFEQDADMLNRKKCPQMAHIMKAVIKLSVEQSQKQLQDSNNFGVESLFSSSHVAEDKKEQKMCPSLNANPHHRHLRKTHGQTTTRQRKNMTFTNDEVHTIDRGNHLLLERLIAVNNRKDKHNSEPPNRHHTNRQPTAAINRRKQDEDIRRDNEIQQRRLQDVKPSRSIVKNSAKEDKYQSSFNQHHQSSYNHHHHHHHQSSNHHHHHSSSNRHHKSHHNNHHNSSSHHNTSSHHNSSSIHHSDSLISPLTRQWQDS